MGVAAAVEMSNKAKCKGKKGSPSSGGAARVRHTLLEGLAPGALGAVVHGVYEITARKAGGCAVWRSEELPDRYLYCQRHPVGVQWYVCIGPEAIGTSSGVLCVSTFASVPHQITQTWKTPDGRGGLVPNGALRARGLPAAEHAAVRAARAQAEAGAAREAAASPHLLLEGQPEGQLHAKYMKVYALLPGARVNGRCVWRSIGGQDTRPDFCQHVFYAPAQTLDAPNIGRHQSSAAGAWWVCHGEGWKQAPPGQGCGSLVLDSDGMLPVSSGGALAWLAVTGVQTIAGQFAAAPRIRSRLLAAGSSPRTRPSSAPRRRRRCARRAQWSASCWRACPARRPLRATWGATASCPARL